MPRKRINKKMAQVKDKRLEYIAARVVQVRKSLSLTQAAIADKLGVTSVSVYQAERHHSSLLLDIIILFTNSYGINPAWILVEDNSKVSQVIERKDPGQIMPEITPVEADNLDSGQLATRIRRDVLKLKEVAANEALAKAKKKKAK
jgi:transcriptional regulator with XRE-family HTH domain